MTLDLTAALDVARRCAREAGALQRQMLADRAHHPLSITMKGPTDLVTEADRQSEALIVKALLATFPDHHIVGEEGGGMGAPVETAAYRWYIDPVDGTTNYAHGYGHWAVSLGLAGADGWPVMGVVYDPSRDELFHAVKGGGAFVNDQPLRVSAVADLGGALIGSGFPYDVWTNPDNNTLEWVAAARRAQSVRCTGSAALDLAYVAAGRLDGYWERGLKLWDYMAAGLMVAEAGGRLSDFRGTSAELYKGGRVVASNGLLHDAIMAIVLHGEDAPRPGMAH